EGVFRLDDSSPVKAVLRDRGLNDEEFVVLSREIEKRGRGFSRVNGHSVPLRLLQEIGRMLIDIHGQSDHVSLNDAQEQLAFLDRYAKAEDLRSRLEAKVERLHKMDRNLKTLVENERETTRHIDLLSFQIGEIRKAKLHEGEEEELQRESAVLSNAEKLKSLSQAAYEALYGRDASVASAVDRMGEAARLLKELVQVDVALSDVLKEVEDALYRVEDTSRALASYQDRLDYDRARQEQVEQRLDLIRNLKYKYGSTAAEIIEYAEKAEEELSQVGLRNEKRAQLQEECATLRNEVGVLSFELSEIRHRVAEELAKQVERELSHLNMQQVGFQILFSNFDAGDELVLSDGRSCVVTRSGIDRVEFSVSTNPGEPLKPLAKIASTGEKSRLMLAIRSVLSKADSTPTLIFDEIDMGIGGRGADVVGRKLSNLSKDHQVICITHLPQVAAYADAHFSICKDIVHNRAIATVTSLSGKARLEEVSAMLGSLSEPALESAQELLEKAETWKRS
ncbi:MAG: DNA repair protein RecN, partial [Chloroflexi bacterium]|nr:DNA repair protein RecN [Chloroflexota bacterium]